jgi:hypothetical protein
LAYDQTKEEMNSCSGKPHLLFLARQAFYLEEVDLPVCSSLGSIFAAGTRQILGVSVLNQVCRRRR